MPKRRNVIVHIGTSADGYIARRDGDLDWPSDEQWQILRAAPRDEADKWRKVVATRANWDDTSATVALSTAVHTAYHLGAIRQILLGLTPNE